MRYIFLILGRACGFDTTFTGEKLFSQSVSVRMLSLKWVFQVVRFLGGEEKKQIWAWQPSRRWFSSGSAGWNSTSKKRREREEIEFPENLGEVCYGCFATKTFFFKKIAFRGIKNSIFCRLQDEHWERGACSQHSFPNKLKTLPGVLKRGLCPNLTIPSTR